MNRLKQAATALPRFNRSHGFGIHSPFAFYFVRSVLREQAAYYCYPRLEALHRAAEHPDISVKTMRMLMRMANYFNIGHIAVIGYGPLAVAALLAANSRASASELLPGVTLSADILLINSISDLGGAAAEALLEKAINAEIPTVLPNLTRKSGLQQLFRFGAQRAMTFTNGKIGIITPAPGRPVQQFSIWF